MENDKNYEFFKPKNAKAKEKNYSEEQCKQVLELVFYKPQEAIILFE